MTICDKQTQTETEKGNSIDAYMSITDRQDRQCHALLFFIFFFRQILLDIEMTDSILFIFFLDVFHSFLLSDYSFFTIFLFFKCTKLCFYLLKLCDLNMKFGFNGLQLFIENVYLILQPADFRLDFNAWPCLVESSLQFIDLSEKLSLFSLVQLASC